MVPLNLSPFIDSYLPWLVAGAIVLCGLVIYGFKDLVRFSFKRSWAISGVIFAESIRRRVWLILLLAGAGVLVVSAFQKPIDEQDAIRQTTKFCLFAAGMVVTITAIILACTNLPRDIESRVIYTVVTKPTTRLEIVVGKVMGFARVSAAILLIMGVCTLLYMHSRAWYLRRHIQTQLDTNSDPQLRPTLEHYRNAGLLAARVYDVPDELHVFSRLPEANDDRRWMFGGGEGQFVVPFRMRPEQYVSAQDPNAPAPIQMLLFVGFASSTLEEDVANEGMARPTTIPYYVQNPEATSEQVRLIRPRQAQRSGPSVTIEILDRNLNTVVEPSLINGGRPVDLQDAAGKAPAMISITPEGVMQLSRVAAFYVAVNGGTSGFEYFTRDKPVVVVSNGQTIDPFPDERRAASGGHALPTFRARTGTFGQQLRGGTRSIPIAVYRFRDARIADEARSAGGVVPFELRSGVEKSTDGDAAEDQPTKVQVTVINRSGSGGTESEPVVVFPESNRTCYFDLPASFITSRDFDVVVRCMTHGHYVGVQPGSLRAVTADESFAFNLFKSLLVLWLLSILVIIISVFCSTFLSWPIAIVLTLLMLLGRWGVMQLGDATAPGIGNLVAQDFGFRRPEIARTVSATVEALSRLLKWVAAVLPDISQFSAVEEIERGIAIPMSRITDALLVLVVFGVPMMVLAYVFLRGKEVAP